MATVTYERKEEIGIIKFSRPEALNALNCQVLRDLAIALQAARDDKGAKVFLLKGEGRAFCAGADVKEARIINTLDEARELGIGVQDITRAIIALGRPIIAVIHGYALGAGCEIAMNCDIRIAAENAILGFPAARVGAMTTNASTYILPRLMGLGKAKELMFTADRIDAKEAERIGLIDNVVPLEELDKEAMNMAKKIASNFPLTVKLIKACIDYGLESSLEATLMAEMNAQSITFAAGTREAGMWGVAGKERED